LPSSRQLIFATWRSIFPISHVTAGCVSFGPIFIARKSFFSHHIVGVKFLKLRSDCVQSKCLESLLGNKGVSEKFFVGECQLTLHSRISESPIGNELHAFREALALLVLSRPSGPSPSPIKTGVHF